MSRYEPPPAHQMSVEGSLLLDQVSQLEWAITGVSRDFGAWDRRRAVSKLTQAALHKPLPHVWRAAKRRLDAPAFKELLSRHHGKNTLQKKVCFYKFARI